jgi:8-oxo-dGTP diphosphatase
MLPCVNELTQNFIVKCRAVILHDDKLLAVRHSKSDIHWALPGGRLERGEDVVTCMRRELVEELGVSPELGKLLYVYNFADRHGNSTVEFFFEIKNGGSYLDCEKLNRTHQFELADIRWVSGGDAIDLLPARIWSDFREGNLLSAETRFLLE